jgi:hypothetical protein
MSHKDTINQAEYLTVKEEGVFVGYHYTDQHAAESIDATGFLGCEWNEALGFTDGGAATEGDGAVFAYTSRECGSEWYEIADPDAVCFKIRGCGYLCSHEHEHDQIIFEADTIEVLEVL